MNAVGSLRARLTMAVVVVLGGVLAAAGLLAWQAAVDSQRAAFDDRLERTAELSRATALAAVQEEVPSDDRRLDAVLKATQTSLRLLLGTRALLETGATSPVRGVQPLGVRTVTAQGTPWRVLTTTLRDPNLGGLARLEVASSLAPLRARERSLAGRLVLIGLVALLVAAVGTWLAADRIIAPLAGLRRFASLVAADDDLSRRVAEDRGPGEVRSLAISVNAMLARLGASARDRQRALDATRRFAADAGHELRTPLTSVQASLDALARHPDAPASQRVAMARDALTEQRRMVSLLDGLQALARGDAVHAPHAPVSLTDVIDTTLAGVQARHGGCAFSTAMPDADIMVVGWEPGLRMVVKNLLENAARHGGARVEISLEADGSTATLTVCDDGPGIPADDRQRVLEAFARLPDTQSEGSGLGLALVAQQAAHHHATVVIDDAPLGGARVRVAFPRG